MSALHIIFRVIYDSFYVFLSLIVLLLLLVTPADNVRLALQNRQNLHVLTTVVCLSATLLFVVLLYFARLYVNRTALANIPKPWIPIGRGEVKKSVRKMIVASLSRSAAIAYESKPRVAPARPPTAMTDPEDLEEEAKAEGKDRKSTLRVFRLKKAPTVEDKMGITLPPHRAVWGEIEHYGWSSPNSIDLPNLQYSTVISELPNLIEAKALTLAPPLPEPIHADPPVLDPEAIGLLQRPDNLALRQYLTQLAELGVLAPSRTTADFLSAYEYARYSTRPISNARFRELMHLFAELLRSMQPLDPAVLLALDDGLSGDEESDIDDDAPRRSPPSTPRSRHSVPSRQRSNASRATTGSGRSGGSGGSYVRRRPNQQQQATSRPQMAARVSSQGTSTWGGGGGAPTFRTAPTTPKTQRTAASPSSISSSSSSANSFAQTRRPFAVGGGGSGSISTSSVASVARSRSGRSSVASGGSAGSVVIRLAGRGDGDGGGVGGLPYVLSLGGDSDR